jgi:large subunit ribosomal protein L32e
MADEKSKSKAKMLKVRTKKKSKKPDFKRQEGYRYKRLDDSWRRPRGRHSKLRKSEKARGKKPSIGYSSPASVRGLTKQGYEPVLVSNKSDLEMIDPEKHIAVIRSPVGKKKRMEIIAAAEEKKIKMLNAYKFKLSRTK